MSKDVPLLVCNSCDTIELAPTPGGAEFEYLLSAHHEYPSGERHVGSLVNVPESAWNSPATREQIVKSIRDGMGGGTTGFDSSVYEVRDTLSDDALACFKQHRRDINCTDFHSAKKELKPPTQSARKELGMASYNSLSKVYLCDYCPVKSAVDAVFYGNVSKGEL